MPPDAFYAQQLDEYARRVVEQDEEIVRLRGELATWGQIWNDAQLLELRVEALRDGTAAG